MILEDQLLVTRLRSQPEFALRLQEVLLTWGLSEKAGLYVQVRPTAAGASLDVDAQAVRQVLQKGAEGEERWWDSLSAPQALSSVHGITALMNSASPDWLVELHRDGHMLAGVWVFPDVRTRDADVRVIVDWYASFFTQFLELAANVAKAANLSGDFVATATLVNAKELRYARSSPHAGAIAGEACAQTNVQWLTYTAAIGTEEWSNLATTMGLGLPGPFRARSR